MFDLSNCRDPRVALGSFIVYMSKGEDLKALKREKDI